MDTNVIRDAVLKRPFQPFVLRMNDGRAFHVRHPEYVAVSPLLVAFIDAEKETGMFLEPYLIASLEVPGQTLLPSAPAPPEKSDDSNGGNP